jgi:capsular exopolysaccharide synthesis family protein
MSKLSDAMDRARRERGRPPIGDDTSPEAVPVVFGASRVDLSASDVEAYQLLGSEIYLSLPELSSRVVLLAAADAGAGTSTVARGLASTMAVNGEIDTLLIEANLRHPEVHAAYKVARAPGITDYVMGDATIDECVRKTTEPHLSILPAGRPAVAPPRVLADERVDELLKNLRNRFELVVFDSAPLIPFAEGLQLSRKVDGVIIVIRSAVTKQQAIQRVLLTLEDAKANVLGSVLNGRKFYIPQFIYDRL